MAESENPVFGGRGAYDTTAGAWDHLLGRVYEFTDTLWVSSTPGAKSQRTGYKVKCMLVKNDSGAALLPKRIVQFTAGSTGKVDGYTTVTGERAAGVVDEFLPAAGVPDDAYFYIVVEGPSLCLTDIAGAANNLIALDTPLIALTAATSGATTAGRVVPLSIITTAATTYTGTELLDFAAKAINQFGVALTARTTTQTNTDILVNTNFRKF